MDNDKARKGCNRITIVVALALIFMVSSLPLYSSENSIYSISAGIGYRKDQVLDSRALFFLDMEYKDLYLGLSMQGLEAMDLLLSYDARVGKTIENVFTAHSNLVFRDGGFSDISYQFGQTFRSKYVDLRYRVGIQYAFLYSRYMSELYNSLSPLAEVMLIGHVAEFMDLNLRLSMQDEREHTWKALPAISIGSLMRVGQHSMIELRAWVRSTVYLLDPWYLTESYGLTVSYRYVGELI